MIIARMARCRILVAWHFDHVHAQRVPPADQAAGRSPTAVRAIATTRETGPAVAMRRPRYSACERRPSSRKKAARDRSGGTDHRKRTGMSGDRRQARPWASASLGCAKGEARTLVASLRMRLLARASL
ncbi:hypothetical protein AQJ43_23865 [Streptomyces avermitilis]|nr:hypothetical protein AQJ43_23865 [Streptomyces avermitilis]